MLPVIVAGVVFSAVPWFFPVMPHADEQIARPAKKTTLILLPPPIDDNDAWRWPPLEVVQSLIAANNARKALLLARYALEPCQGDGLTGPPSDRNPELCWDTRAWYPERRTLQYRRCLRVIEDRDQFLTLLFSMIRSRDAYFTGHTIAPVRNATEGDEEEGELMPVEVPSNQNPDHYAMMGYLYQLQNWYWERSAKPTGSLAFSPSETIEEAGQVVW